MKHLLLIAFSMLLLVGCIHHGKEEHTYILDTPNVNISEKFEITDLTMPSYLCSTAMRYTSDDGELHTIPNAKWALPLDKLLRVTADDTLRNLPKSTLNAKRGIRFDRVCLTEKKTLLFTGEFSLLDDASGRMAHSAPFRIEITIKDELNAREYRNAVIIVLGKLLQKEL